MADFYDALAPYYHLIYPDWSASVRRQGEQLADIIEAAWPGSSCVLDVACGIGTQTIALAAKGYSVIGSDLSTQAIARACDEAASWDVDIPFSVCDMREAHHFHGTGFNVVVCADNALPHLLDDQDILLALRSMRACLVDGGGVIISVRDYALEERGRNLLKPYGVRLDGDKRYMLFQIWDFDTDGQCYDLTLYLIEEDLRTHATRSQALRSRYYAIDIDHLADLMREVGFKQIRRLDSAFYQPVLVGTRRA